MKTNHDSFHYVINSFKNRMNYFLGNLFGLIMIVIEIWERAWIESDVYDYIIAVLMLNYLNEYI